MIEMPTRHSGMTRLAGILPALKCRLLAFLLSLINATLVLAIVFAVTALILVDRIETFAASVISDVKFAVLQDIDTDVRQVAGAIRTTNTKLQTIAKELEEVVRSPAITLSPAMQDDVRLLIANLTSLRQSIVHLTSSHEALSDQSIRAIGATVANAIVDIRQCRVRPVQP